MKTYKTAVLVAASMLLAGCSDAYKGTELGPGKTADNPDEYYAGGKLGTTALVNAYAYQQPTQAVENAGLDMEFQNGETLFERDFNYNTEGAFTGLGPLAVRVGCLYCHPNYGHGKRQDRYRARDMGNGYLLVVYDKKTDSYVMSLAGMPQTIAQEPFKAPIDETKIEIKWEPYVDEWGNKFDDGETYSLFIRK